MVIGLAIFFKEHAPLIPLLGHAIQIFETIANFRSYKRLDADLDGVLP